MNKELILTKSHFRKNRPTAIGLFLLMFLAAAVVSMSMLIFMDAYPTAGKVAEELDARDGYMLFTKDISGVDDEYLGELIGEDAVDHYSYKTIIYDVMSVPFGEGGLSLSVLLDDHSAFEKRLGRTEIVTEDESVNAPYIYLPYQFYTSGGVNIGDTYEIEISDKTYSFNVKGFTNTPYFGCNNNGKFEFVLDDASYAKIYDNDHETYEGIVLVYDLKDGVKDSAFQIGTGNQLLKDHPGTVVRCKSAETTNSERSFMALIIAVSFLTITIIILFAIVMMLINSISNYIKENMKSIGALKAIGYTSANIRNSLLILFAGLSLTGSVLGVIVSYIMMPLMAKFIVAQMGVPYKVSFSPIATVISLGLVFVITVAATILSLRKVKKIQPIVALREGTEAHNFKKNHVRLDKSVFGIDWCLALKTMIVNKKQNIITFFVTGIIIFVCTIGLLMYENFNRNPRLELLSFEICSGVAAFDWETKEEGREYLEDRDDVYNIKRMIQLDLYYNDEDKLTTYIFDDLSRLNNKEICYEGRVPEYENEVAISGKFARDYGFEIGDEIRLDYGDESFDYLISGFIQTANNNGREAVMSELGAEHIFDFTYAPAYFYFDSDGKDATTAILDDCVEKYGDHAISTMNFDDILEGSMTTFKGLAALMLIVVCVISGVVILLVLYLLIRSLVYSKRREFGIYKALGYTSGSLILQTAVSFMPSIVLSVLVFSIISYYAANPYMGLIMFSFGLMKCTFTLPIVGVVLIGVFFIVLAFAFAVLESRRIKGIEPYKMLVAE